MQTGVAGISTIREYPSQLVLSQMSLAHSQFSDLHLTAVCLEDSTHSTADEKDSNQVGRRVKGRVCRVKGNDTD